jgi:predicted DNA-binding transcriptional regulator AlpA
MSSIQRNKYSSAIESQNANLTGVLRRPRPIRCLCRTDAAAYISVSPSMFDEMVKDGSMPKPIEMGARRLWDITDLDEAIEAWKTKPSANPWDDPES